MASIRHGSDVVPHRWDRLATGRERRMHNIFWLIGVIVVVLIVLSFLGLR
jgi:hypothetical protein